MQLRLPLKLDVCVMSKDQSEALDLAGKTYDGNLDLLETEEHYVCTIDHFCKAFLDQEEYDYLYIYIGTDCLIVKISVEELVQQINIINNGIYLN